MRIVWIGAAIVFGIAEAATAGLVTIWFVGGALAALVAASLHAALWLQLVLFFGVSTVLLIATRPLARRIREKAVPTNLDRVLNKPARVTETVDNERSTGAVYIEGKTWTARSEDGSVLAKDTMAEVVRMEGVKLFVREKKQEV
ncbi:MAG: NfeD family protein [Oscillospiraceae bacterium]|nr:NfeD family protein [Oscillospiraceae bacterium]